MQFKKIYILLPLIILAFQVRITIVAQETLVNPSCGCPYTETELRFAKEEELMLKVDSPASYLGGEKAYNRFISYLMQNPAQNKNDSDSYSLICRFIIERDGTITHIEYLNHTEEKFENEATKIINAMPKWNPAQKDGKAVRSWHNIKLFFGKGD